MTTPINLNKVRKARAKTEKRTRADENAVKHGRKKTEKTRDAAVKSAEIRRLDGRKRDS